MPSRRSDATTSRAFPRQPKKALDKAINRLIHCFLDYFITIADGMAIDEKGNRKPGAGNRRLSQVVPMSKDFFVRQGKALEVVAVELRRERFDAV